MGRTDTKFSAYHRVTINGRMMDYRLVRSTSARKLRVRVGPSGVEVTQPITSNGEQLSEFLSKNQNWIAEQLDRIERLLSAGRLLRRTTGQIYYRGNPTRVHVEATPSRAGGNTVRLIDGCVVVSSGPGSRTPVARSLENWLRREVRTEIDAHLAVIVARIGHRPHRVYIMNQRTKWGNCSARSNLSFNWRLIFAPDYVLRYLVTHEAVHLAVPDHSARFWLTVQSLCRETEKARQWLSRHQAEMWVDLECILSVGGPRRQAETRQDLVMSPEPASE